jgi:hypothetical protein
MSAKITLAAVALFVIGLAPLIPIPWTFGQFAPLSFVTIGPAFFVASTMGRSLGEIPGLIIGGVIGAIVAPLIFVLLGRRVLKGKSRPGWPTVAVFMIVTILSFVAATFGWSATVQYTSLSRAAALAVQCVLPPLLVSGVFVSRKHLTGGWLIGMYWFALAWFTWSAFPTWGELP